MSDPSSLEQDLARPSRRSGGHEARKSARRAPPAALPPQGVAGGAYRPLSDGDVQRILKAAYRVLETIGMGVIGDMPEGAKTILANGASLSSDGRILIPQAMVEDALGLVPRSWTLFGTDPARSIEIAPGKAHYGTAGGAVQILDSRTGHYRDTTLADLYDMARLVDTLAYIRWCYRTPIARDMETVELLDINTAYGLVRGTSKPLGITLGSAANVRAVVKLFDLALGREGQFRKTPCAHMVQGAGVPPLRFAADRCLIKEEAIRQGFPVMIASAPQAGATSPAALAGTLVQVTAESLAGIVYANAVSPGCPLTFAPWPFVSDLRTGAMSGGSGEQALLMAGAAQIGLHLGIPCSVAAGMADSKLPDAQSGYEKAYTTLLAGQAGASMVHEAAGMHASLMGCSLESFVIDNDMLGSVLRTIRGIEVNEELLSVDVIRDVVIGGPGHYLGSAQTLEVMQTEYHYPSLSDRETPSVWEQKGSKDIFERAREYVAKVLAEHHPGYIDRRLDEKIRSHFDIRLPPRP